MLEDLLTRRGVAVEVATMGFLTGGVPISPEVLRASAPFGVRLEGHVSQGIDRARLAEALLVLTMTRRHLREIVVMEPSVWPRTFTLRELARRGSQVGPRDRGTTLEEWVAAVHHGRAMAESLGEDPADDVADPRGSGSGPYDEMAATLFRTTTQIVDLLWPV
jgi:protein-tyrosine-phosphatase